MGADIHIVAQRLVNGVWETIHPPTTKHPETRWPDGEIWPAYESNYWKLEGRCYRIFGFLANVRNLSHSPVIQPLEDLDFESRDKLCQESGLDEDLHSCGILTLKELNDYPYGLIFFNDYRCAPGTQELVNLGAFLGEGYFNALQELNYYLVDRIIFGFDN